MSKKSFKKLIGLFLVITFTLTLLAGCGAGDKPASEPKEAPQQLKKMSMGTATSAGGWFIIGAQMAQSITKHAPGMELTAEVSAGSVENFRNIDSGSVQMAMVQPDTAHFYRTGTGDYEGKPHEDIRALWNMFSSIGHIIVPENSPIRTLTDLKGKSVAVGAPGSGNEMCSRFLLKAIGLTYDDIDEKFISSAQMMDALKDGQIDAAMPTYQYPNSSITDMTLTTKVRFIGFTPEQAKKFVDDTPGYYAYTMKKDDYKGVETDILVPAFRGIVVLKKDTLTEEEAYNLVKALWEFRDEWKGAHAQTSEITLDQQLKGWSVQLHAGAYKYYKEKGLNIPDELIPPEVQK